MPPKTTGPTTAALTAALRSVDRALAAKAASGDGKPAELAACHGATLFQRAVWAATTLVPAGKVATYKTIAEWSRRLVAAEQQLPAAAAAAGDPPVRATGQALKRNPLAPAPVPCHRVVAAGGKIGGFCGSTGAAELSRKCALLLAERVELRDPFGKPRSAQGAGKKQKAAAAERVAATVVAERCVL